jgi:hypothetical protein
MRVGLFSLATILRQRKGKTAPSLPISAGPYAPRRAAFTKTLTSSFPQPARIIPHIRLFIQVRHSASEQDLVQGQSSRQVTSMVRCAMQLHIA